MKRFEVRRGEEEDSDVVGVVVAGDEIEAVATLQAFKNGFKVTDPATAGVVPYPYIEWAHPQIEKLHPIEVMHWRARLLE